VCAPVGSDVFIARTRTPEVQVAGRQDHRIFKWAISAVKALRSLD